MTTTEPDEEVLERAALGVEKVIPTGVPGIVLWQWKRRTLTLGGRRGFMAVDDKPRKVRSRSYSVTHEASGRALLPGADGKSRVSRTRAEALGIAAKLGDVPGQRGKPIDWTKPMDELTKGKQGQHLRDACFSLAGWLTISTRSTRFSPEIRSWAARHDVKLELGDKP